MDRFRNWYYSQPLAIRTLLAINVIVYVVWQVVLIRIEPAFAFVWSHLALNPSIPGILYEPWQLITYNFLHMQPGFGGFLHILFNMLWFLWIGREYEQMHGPHRVVAIYLIGGVGGGLVTVILSALFPQGEVFVHGASASVLGLMTAVAVQYPQKSIALMFIGVVRLIHVVIGFLAIDILFSAGSSTSITAHLGGVLAGWLFAKAFLAGRDPAAWARIFFSSSGGRATGDGFLRRMEAWFIRRNSASGKTASSGGKGSSRKSATIHKMDTRERGSPDDQSQRDIDQILDKISESGYESLTSKEKRALYDASQKD